MVPARRKVVQRKRGDATHSAINDNVSAVGLAGKFAPYGIRFLRACGKGRGGEKKRKYPLHLPALAFLMRFSMSTSLAFASA